MKLRRLRDPSGKGDYAQLEVQGVAGITSEVEANREGGVMSFERRFEITPGFDKRDPDPAKNYGIGCATMRFYLIGPRGAVQFVCMTGWYPHLIKKTTFDDWSDWDELHVQDMAPHDSPEPSDLGYHSPTPRYEGQQVMSDECQVLGGPCYYDGSSLNAMKPFSILVHEGSERLWEFLELYYRDTFECDSKEAE